MGYERIVGNGKALARLRALVRKKRVAQAYVFAGSEGVGKRSAAVEFARAILCPESRGEACETCDDCRRTSRGTHPGILLVRREEQKREILIAQVREVIRALSYVGEGARVVVVDEAERLNEEAQNAFLKTLEEPPRGVVLILVTSAPAALLPTIRSRCHTVLFFPLLEEDLRGLLSLPREEADLVVSLADGSAARALELAQDPEARQEESRDVLGKIRSGDLSPLVEGVAKIRDLRKAREKAQRVLRIAALALRRAIRAGGDADVDTLADRIEMLLDHERLIDLNVNVPLAVENALLRIECPSTT